MILTITLNPSIDSAYFIKHFEIGRTNRSVNQIKSIGGKGVNAARTAALSGSKVIVTGFLAGNSGKIVQQYLKHEQLFDIYMPMISGETRNAITIMHDEEIQTEIIEKGPEVSSEQVFKLLSEIKNMEEITQLSAICIAGSVNTKQTNLYLEMLTYIKEKINPDLPVFMDISGDQLVSILESKIHHPTFIKPNLDELSTYLNLPVTDKMQAIHELHRSCFQAIHYILVSCGSSGAICKVENDFYDIEIPKIPTLNPTGSGDASVGGFLHGISERFTLEKTLKYAMACGMSNAQHGEVGKIDLADTLEFMDKIKVTKIEGC